MKQVILFFFAVLSVSAGAQVPNIKGTIQTTTSLPGTIGFVVIGKAAETIFNQLSVETFANAYMAPGEVLTKTGHGISCDKFVKFKTYSCQFATTPDGIFIP